MGEKAYHSILTGWEPPTTNVYGVRTPKHEVTRKSKGKYEMNIVLQVANHSCNKG